MNVEFHYLLQHPLSKLQPKLNLECKIPTLFDINSQIFATATTTCRLSCCYSFYGILLMYTGMGEVHILYGCVF